jgi:hypothetical protein
MQVEQFQLLLFELKGLKESLLELSSLTSSEASLGLLNIFTTLETLILLT